MFSLLDGWENEKLNWIFVNNLANLLFEKKRFEVMLYSIINGYEKDITFNIVLIDLIWFDTHPYNSKLYSLLIIFCFVLFIYFFLYLAFSFCTYEKNYVDDDQGHFSAKPIIHDNWIQVLKRGICFNCKILCTW